MTVSVGWETTQTPGDSGIFVKLVNGSNRMVFLPPDIFVERQRFADGQWSAWSAWFVLDGGPRYISVQAGDSIRAEFDSPRYASVTGPHRFRYRVYEDSRFRRLLPEEMRISNTIELLP